MLTLFSHDDEAAELQEKFESLQNSILKSLNEIWPEDVDDGGNDLPVSSLITYLYIQ